MRRAAVRADGGRRSRWQTGPRPGAHPRERITPPQPWFCMPPATDAGAKALLIAEVPSAIGACSARSYQEPGDAQPGAMRLNGSCADQYPDESATDCATAFQNAVMVRSALQEWAAEAGGAPRKRRGSWQCCSNRHYRQERVHAGNNLETRPTGERTWRPPWPPCPLPRYAFGVSRDSK